MNTKVIGIIIGALLVLGGGYLLLGGQDALLTPEQEIIKAMQNTAELNSLTMDTEIDVKVVEGGQEYNFLLSMVTNAKETEDGIGEAESRITGEFFVEGMTINFAGNLVQVDDNLYGRVDTLPLGIIPDIPQELNELLGQDILILENVSERTEEDLAELNEELAKAFEEEGLDPMTINEIVEELENVFVMALEREVVKVTDKERDEVDGERATRYTVEIDIHEIPDFMIELGEEYDGVFPGIDKEEIIIIAEDMRGELEDLEDFEKIEFFIWTDGQYVKQIQFVYDFEDEEVAIDFGITMKFSNFNEDFEIVAPVDYIALEEAQEIIMGALYPFGAMPMGTIEMDYPYEDDFNDLDDIDEEMLEEIMLEFQQ